METTVVGVTMASTVRGDPAVSAQKNLPVYDVFGRRICSCLALPAPEVVSAEEDWRLLAGAESAPENLGDAENLIPAGRAGGFSAGWMGRFDLAGRDVWLQPRVGVRLDELVSMVTGALSALLLAHDGRLVLHGTTLRRQGRLVVICGAAGAGKSTQSAFLACHGWDLHADDVAPIEIAGPEIAMFPGYGGIRLFPDSLKLVGLDPESFPLVYRGTTKRFATIGPRRSEAGRPLPLAGVILLEEGAGFDAARLDEREAVVTLLNMQHPTAARVVDRSAADRAKAFAACVRIAQRVPLLRIRRAKTAENLPRCAEAIASEFGVK